MHISSARRVYYRTTRTECVCVCVCGWQGERLLDDENAFRHPAHMQRKRSEIIIIIIIIDNNDDGRAKREEEEKKKKKNRGMRRRTGRPGILGNRVSLLSLSFEDELRRLTWLLLHSSSNGG